MKRAEDCSPAPSAIPLCEKAVAPTILRRAPDIRERSRSWFFRAEA